MTMDQIISEHEIYIHSSVRFDICARLKFFFRYLASVCTPFSLTSENNFTISLTRDDFYLIQLKHY